ncbi:MAG TPA: nitroreductase family protein [Nanoarchaeota archaeon]|nr:nitroreductase family protein [Nanoarchaeota archaeon]
MDLQESIKSRRSIREFTDKKPDWREIIEAIHSAQYAPMVGNLFPMKFLIVDDEKIIAEIAKWSEQEFINQAKYVIVLISDEGIVTTPFPDKGEIFLRQEAGAAIENFLLSLTEYGLSTCWIGHFNEEKVRKSLKVPEAYTIEAIFPIGYSKEKPKKSKPKSDIYNLLYFNQWGNNRMRKIEKIDSRAPEGY